MPQANWGIPDYNLGTARTPLNLQPGIENYFLGQQNQRQNSLAELTMTKWERKQKRDAELKQIQQQNVGNPQGMIQGLERAGYSDEARKAKIQIANAQKARFEQKQAEDTFKTNKMDKFAKTYANLPDLSEGKTERIDYYHDKIQPFTGGPAWSEQMDQRLLASAKTASGMGVQARVRQLPTKDGIVNFYPDGTSEFARDDKGEVLKPPSTYKSVAGEDQLYRFDSKSGEFVGTGIKPKGKALERVKIAETTQKTQIAGEKWEEEKGRNLEKHKKLKLANSSEIAEIQAFADLASSIAGNEAISNITGIGVAHPVKGLAMPGSAGSNLRVDLDRLIAMGAIQTMAKLKRESPTGSTGFGALSQKELSVIQNAFAGLESKMQSPAKLKKELQRISDIMNKYMLNIRQFESQNTFQPDITEDQSLDAGIEGL